MVRLQIILVVVLLVTLSAACVQSSKPAETELTGFIKHMHDGEAKLLVEKLGLIGYRSGNSLEELNNAGYIEPAIFPEQCMAGETAWSGSPFFPQEDSAIVFLSGKRVLAWIRVSDGVLSQSLGISTEELHEQYMQLHAQYNGGVEDRATTALLAAGKTYGFTTDSVQAKMFAVEDSLPEPQLSFYTFNLTDERLIALLKKTEVFTELAEHGTENKPAGLQQLLEIVDEQGALGIISRYDLSQMEYQEGYASILMPHLETCKKSISYISPQALEGINDGFYLAAKDDGASMKLSFTESWYEEANQRSITELSAEFDELLHLNEGGVRNIDADCDEYDMEFSWFTQDDTLVVRKVFPQPPTGVGKYWFVINNWTADNALETLDSFSNANWPRPDYSLPEISPNAGQLELLAREMAQSKVADFVTKHGLIEEHGGGPFRCTTAPYTMLSLYQRDTEDLSAFMALSAIDATVPAQITFASEWFIHQPGGLEALEDEIALLSERFDAVTDEQYVDQDRVVSTTVIPYGDVAFKYIVSADEGEVSFSSIEIQFQPEM